MDCGVYSATGDPWLTMLGGGSAGGGVGGQMIGGALSHESEHDLAAMVSDFLENGSSCGADSRCSSDSDSGFCELAHLADKISKYKILLDQHGVDMLSVVNSLILSIDTMDLDMIGPSSCSASCIRFSLVNLLRLSGYDAAVCTSRWQGSGKVPGGDHEYIDIVNHHGSDRLIVDMDFRSHFEIARAVAPYDRILNSLPVVYVGPLPKLKQFLKVMAEAAKSSLKQNSMPLPPWRSLAYLQAKWQSPYHRKTHPPQEQQETGSGPVAAGHARCTGHLERLKSLVQFEMEKDRSHSKKPVGRGVWRPVGVQNRNKRFAYCVDL